MTFGPRLPLAASLALLALASTARAELPPLIRRDLLFGNPERALPQLSPDGTRLAWLVDDDRNALQVWVRPALGGEVRKITNDPGRGIRQYGRAEDGRTLPCIQDAHGDENFHLFGVDLATGAVRDFTPFQ